LARRFASPLFLPAASSYHEVLTVAQLDKADAACAEADAAHPDEGFCHAVSHLFIPRLLLPTLPTYHFLCKDCAKTCGWSGREGRDASSALGSEEAGDGGMGKATRAAIARIYEVDRGNGGGESGAREGGGGGTEAGSGGG